MSDYSEREVQALLNLQRAITGRVDPDWALVQVERLDRGELARPTSELAEELVEKAPAKFRLERGSASGNGGGGRSAAEWDAFRERLEREKRERARQGRGPSLDERLGRTT